jgi:DNA replication protein DnaC
MSWEKILELENSNVAEAKQAVMEVVRRGWGWVYLWGTYGTAKTIMLKTAAVEWMKSTGRPACFTTMADLLDTVREAYHPHAPNGESLRRLRHYGAVDLLAVDEVDRIKATDWAQEKQFQVLNWRYDLVTSQGSGVTLIAANTAPEALDGALASRVRDGRFSVVHMTGRDMHPWAQVITGG